MNGRILKRALKLGLSLATALHLALVCFQQPGAPDTLSEYDAAVLADEPDVYWTMAGAESGSEIDLGDAGINGAYTGRPTETTLPNGDPAADFDGATQYFEAPDAAALSPATTGVITIEAWMRPDVLQFPNDESSGYVHWMGKGEAGQHEYVSRMYSLENTENRPHRISGYSFNLSGGLGAGSYFQDPVEAGEWIHYVLVINANATSEAFPNGYTKVYRDGVLRDQDDLSIRGQVIVPERGSAPFRAGTRDFASWFDGAVGKIAIWDTELTAEQIAAHTAAMTD
ncbi:LamG domain-containing protein [Jiangella gansuensis]|uniref:LamG domain-containing protein n=1 Tax=Jiangella gansuensis TaxID=281473 RepID=UPI0004B90EBA|nr:LamG domain-containing protein [Jiangella gansuensis]